MNTHKIRLSKSVIGEEEKKAVASVLDEGYLGMGQYVQTFENNLSSYLDNTPVTCVNTGTSALHLALMSLQLPAESEVLVQSLTYVASFQAISASGLVPVPCEITPNNCLIDLDDAEKRITEKTKAIMPVHYVGNPGNLDALYAFAKKHNLRVIEDAAHAFGTLYKGKKIGSFGDIVCFSFDGIKNITSGEGGAIVTHDDAVTEYVKNARLLGVVKDTDQRYMGGRTWVPNVHHQGYRFHMSNLFAAIGIEQLKKFDAQFKATRQARAKRYQALLKDIPGITLFEHNYDDVTPHIFPIKTTQQKAIQDALIANNIEAGIHYRPNHLLTFYGEKKGALPITEAVYQTLLTLPLHPEITKDDQDRIVSTIKAVLLATA